MTNSKAEVERQLIDSFKALVMVMPVEKITIREITDRAVVNRTTFYNHFQDKYEVIERIFWQEIINPTKPLMENDMIHETVLLIFKNLQKEKPFYEKLSRMEGQNSLEQIVGQCIHRLLVEYMEQHISEEKQNLLKQRYHWLNMDMIAEYYARSMTFVMMTWLQNNTEVTPEEVAQVYTDILHRSLEDIIKDLI